MTDNDKKRIEEAARRYLESSVVNNSQVRKFTTYSTFKSGAEYEHPIAHKEGWNEAIDKALSKIFSVASNDVSVFFDLVNSLKK